MTTYDIPNGDSEYDIQDSFSKYILAAQDAISVSAGHAIFIDTGNINDQVIIKGQVVASNNDEVAFVSNATGTTLTIAAMGSIRGPDVESVQMNGVGSAVINQGMIEGGVVFNGDNSDVINTGAIVSTTGSALSLSANGITAENAGLLYGGDGIYNFGDHNIVKLDKTSFISAAVGIYDKAGIDLHIVNAGRITAAVAIQAHDSVTIVNTGVIEGVINLSSDADRFDDRGGKIDGTVLGGNGDDVLITDKATDILSEKVNQGTDTVKASVTYTLSANVEDLILFGKADVDGTGNKLDNVITGNSADNTLSGGSGSDTLDGAGGNDTLVGGSGADVFVFETHGGHDVITKFVDGDVLNFSRWDDIQSWHELIHGGHLSEDDGNLIIHAGSDSLTLIGMTEADLTKADVSFHALS